MFKCTRCGKDTSENSYMGLCRDCATFGKKVTVISDKIFIADLYAFIKVNNVNNWCVINEEDLMTLFRTDCNIDNLYYDEDAHDIFYGDNKRFSDVIKELHGLKSLPSNNIFDLRVFRFK